MASGLKLRCVGRLLLCRNALKCKIITQQTASYAKKPLGKGKAAAQAVTGRKFLDPETDPAKLTKFVCGANIMKDGQDPDIKPDSEYPEWLWTLRTERGAEPLENLKEDTWEYWNRLLKAEKKSIALNRKIKNKYKVY